MGKRRKIKRVVFSAVVIICLGIIARYSYNTFLPKDNQNIKVQKKKKLKSETKSTVKLEKKDASLLANKDNSTSEAKIVTIDAGHQAKGNNELEAIGPGSKQRKPKVTSGTTGKFTHKLESEVNLEVALKLQSILESRGYKVVMVRTSQNVNISNIERAEIANNANANINVRLHCDGSDNSSLSGFFVLTPSQNNRYLSQNIVSDSLKLSNCLLSSIEKTTSAKNRGISYRDDLTGTNWSKVPTTLVEMGEMSNKEEDYNLSNPDYQLKMATGIADGIDEYFKE